MASALRSLKRTAVDCDRGPNDEMFNAVRAASSPRAGHRSFMIEDHDVAAEHGERIARQQSQPVNPLVAHDRPQPRMEGLAGIICMASMANRVSCKAPSTNASGKRRKTACKPRRRFVEQSMIAPPFTPCAAAINAPQSPPSTSGSNSAEQPAFASPDVVNPRYFRPLLWPLQRAEASDKLSRAQSRIVAKPSTQISLEQ